MLFERKKEKNKDTTIEKKTFEELKTDSQVMRHTAVHLHSYVSTLVSSTILDHWCCDDVTSVVDYDWWFQYIPKFHSLRRIIPCKRHSFSVPSYRFPLSLHTVTVKQQPWGLANMSRLVWTLIIDPFSR